MSKIRFNVTVNGTTTISDWEDEHITWGTGPHTAVARVAELRALHGPNAAISIEREGRKSVRPDRYRYRIRVRDAMVPVHDDGNITERRIQNMTVYSRPYGDDERDTVLAELKAQFPKATFSEEKVQ